MERSLFIRNTLKRRVCSTLSNWFKKRYQPLDAHVVHPAPWAHVGPRPYPPTSTLSTGAYYTEGVLGLAARRARRGTPFYLQSCAGDEGEGTTTRSRASATTRARGRTLFTQRRGEGGEGGDGHGPSGGRTRSAGTAARFRRVSAAVRAVGRQGESIRFGIPSGKTMGNGLRAGQEPGGLMGKLKPGALVPPARGIPGDRGAAAGSTTIC